MFDVTPIAAFQDNYIWLLRQPGSQDAFVVDPGDAAPVLRFLDQQRLNLAGILITHHHADHTGGVAELIRRHPVPVLGPAHSPFSGSTQTLEDGDHCQVLGATLRVKHVPGHTLDHICYYLAGPQPQLFCGDTLFLAGCGRLFEGTAGQMLAAMNFFNQLPGDTRVYCTHEYSLANLAFAAAVEPENPDIRATIDWCTRQRQQHQPTLPSTIDQERRVNPFLRTRTPAVISAAERHAGRALADEEAVFASIRAWKNEF